jgi:hypothetical protein
VRVARCGAPGEVEGIGPLTPFERAAIRGFWPWVAISPLGKDIKADASA